MVAHSRFIKLEDVHLDSLIITGCVVDPVTYRKISNIRRTKSQNLNDSRLVLQLSLPNLLKPGVKVLLQCRGLLRLIR